MPKKEKVIEVCCIICTKRLRGERRKAAEHHQGIAMCSVCDRHLSAAKRDRERPVDR